MIKIRYSLFMHELVLVPGIGTGAKLTINFPGDSSTAVPLAIFSVSSLVFYLFIIFETI